MDMKAMVHDSSNKISRLTSEYNHISTNFLYRKIFHPEILPISNFRARVL